MDRAPGPPVVTHPRIRDTQVYLVVQAFSPLSLSPRPAQRPARSLRSNREQERKHLYSTIKCKGGVSCACAAPTLLILPLSTVCKGSLALAFTSRCHNREITPDGSQRSEHGGCTWPRPPSLRAPRYHSTMWRYVAKSHSTVLLPGSYYVVSTYLGRHLPRYIPKLTMVLCRSSDSFRCWRGDLERTRRCRPGTRTLPRDESTSSGAQPCR